MKNSHKKCKTVKEIKKTSKNFERQRENAENEVIIPVGKTEKLWRPINLKNKNLTVYIKIQEVHIPWMKRKN